MFTPIVYCGVLWLSLGLEKHRVYSQAILFTHLLSIYYTQAMIGEMYLDRAMPFFVPVYDPPKLIPLL